MTGVLCTMHVLHGAFYLLFMLATRVIQDVVAQDSNQLATSMTNAQVESDSRTTTQKINTLRVNGEPEKQAKTPPIATKDRAKTDIIDGYRNLKKITIKELAKELTANSQLYFDTQDIKVLCPNHLICNKL